MLPPDASGDFLADQTDHFGIRKRAERTRFSAFDELIAEIYPVSETNPISLASYLTSGEISFVGVVPDRNLVIIGDHSGDLSICSIESA